MYLGALGFQKSDIYLENVGQVAAQPLPDNRSQMSGSAVRNLTYDGTATQPCCDYFCMPDPSAFSSLPSFCSRSLMFL
jgi:hypothetical protein